MAGWKKLLFIGGGGLVPGAIIGFRFQYYKRIEEKEVIASKLENMVAERQRAAIMQARYSSEGIPRQVPQ